MGKGNWAVIAVSACGALSSDAAPAGRRSALFFPRPDPKNCIHATLRHSLPARRVLCKRESSRVELLITSVEEPRSRGSAPILPEEVVTNIWRQLIAQPRKSKRKIRA